MREVHQDRNRHPASCGEAVQPTPRKADERPGNPLPEHASAGGVGPIAQRTLDTFPGDRVRIKIGGIGVPENPVEATWAVGDAHVGNMVIEEDGEAGTGPFASRWRECSPDPAVLRMNTAWNPCGMTEDGGARNDRAGDGGGTDHRNVPWSALVGFPSNMLCP